MTTPLNASARAGGGGGVERLIDAGEDAAIEKYLEKFLGAHVQLFGQIADSDAFGDCYFAAADAEPAAEPQLRERGARLTPGRVREPDGACVRPLRSGDPSWDARGRRACVHKLACLVRLCRQAEESADRGCRLVHRLGPRRGGRPGTIGVRRVPRCGNLAGSARLAGTLHDWLARARVKRTRQVAELRQQRLGASLVERRARTSGTLRRP